MKKLVYSMVTAVAIVAFAAPAFAQGDCSGSYTVSVPGPVTTADADTSPAPTPTPSGG